MQEAQAKTLTLKQTIEYDNRKAIVISNGARVSGDIKYCATKYGMVITSNAAWCNRTAVIPDVLMVRDDDDLLEDVVELLSEKGAKIPTIFIDKAMKEKVDMLVSLEGMSINDLGRLFEMQKAVFDGVNVKDETDILIRIATFFRCNYVLLYGATERAPGPDLTKYNPEIRFFVNESLDDHFYPIYCIVQPFITKDRVRNSEVMQAIQKLAANPYLERVYALTESELNFEKYVAKDNARFVQVVTGEWLTYEAAFKYAADNFPAKCNLVIIHADSYLDDSIANIHRFNLNRACLALLGQRQRNEKWELSPNAAAQEAWVFRAPYPDMGDVSVPIGKPNADKVFATILLRKKYMLYNCCATIHVLHNHASNFKRQWAQSDIQKVDVYTLLEPHGCTDFRVHKSVEDKYLDTRIKEYEKFVNKKVQSVGDIDTLLWWNDRTHKWKAEAPAPTYFGASGRFYRMKNVSLYNDTFMRLADIYSLTVRDGFNIDIASGVNVVDRAFNCAFSYDYMTLTDTLIGLIPLVYMGVKHYPEFPPIMIPNKHLGRVGKYFKNFPGVIIKPLNANFYVKDFVTTDCGRMFHPHHEWIKNMRKYLVDRGSAKVKRSELGDAVGGTQVGGTQVGAGDISKDSVAKKKVTSMVEGMTTPGEELRVMLSKYGGAEMKSATEVMDVCREIGERVKEIAEYAEVYSAEAQEIMESVKISEDDSRHRKTDGALDLGALAAEEENKDDDMVVYPSRDVVIRDATLFQSNEAWNKLREMLRAKHPERDWMFVDPLTDENVIFDAIPALLNARTFTCYQDEYMAFMVFLPDNCRVIEIQYEEKADLRYWHVAQSIGMDYTVIPLKREPIQVQVEVALKRLDLYFGGRSVDMGEGHVGSVPMMLGGPVARNLEKPRVIIPDNLQLNLANKAFGEGMWAHNREEGFWGVLSQWHKRGYIDLAVSNTANPNIWMFGMGDILLYERDNLDYLGANLEYETGLFGGPYPVKENVRNKRWIYWAKYPELLDSMATDDAIQGWSGRTVGSIFYAAIKNSVQKAHRGGIAWDKYVDDCQLTTGGAYRVDKADYYRRVMTARFGVCVPGNGYKTSHEIEYMAFGTVPIMMKDVDVNYAVPLVEGVHYISVSAATEIPKVVRSMDEATWVRMSRACREWWKRCASVEGAFRTTMGCVRAAVAK